MLRDQAERRKLKGLPVWSWGTPPTPDDPHPSNVVTQTYPDGTFDTRIPPATNKVIAEYEEAIETWPDCAELRIDYAFSLSLAGMKDAAIAQTLEAIRIRPEWDRARRFLNAGESMTLEPVEATLVVAVAVGRTKDLRAVIYAA
jgi:hypothetical protein